MRVCIPIEFKPQGGGHYFLQSLAGYLTTHGWAVTDRLGDAYDVLFTNHWMVSPRKVSAAVLRNPHVRVVHRIDGAAVDYGRAGDADRWQALVNRRADLTVFQSDYCRYSTREKFPIIVNNGPVIHNPVDVAMFRPDGPSRELPGTTRVACVTWSTNPLKGARAIYDVARENLDIAFILCGRYPEAPELPNLHRLGVLDRGDLAATLRSCHVLLTFSENEACPNHVLEALGSGLPVLYHDSGAMAEVIGDCGVPVTTQTFRPSLERVLSDRMTLTARARARAVARFHPDVIFPRYLEEIERVCARATACSPFRRYLGAMADLVHVPAAP